MHRLVWYAFPVSFAYLRVFVPVIPMFYLKPMNVPNDHKVQKVINNDFFLIIDTKWLVFFPILLPPHPQAVRSAMHDLWESSFGHWPNTTYCTTTCFVKGHPKIEAFKWHFCEVSQKSFHVGGSMRTGAAEQWPAVSAAWHDCKEFSLDQSNAAWGNHCSADHWVLVPV